MKYQSNNDGDTILKSSFYEVPNFQSNGEEEEVKAIPIEEALSSD